MSRGPANPTRPKLVSSWQTDAERVLQWHNMLSSIRPPNDLVSMKVNMLWFQVFHAFTWLLTVLGIFQLWSATRRGYLTASTSNWIGTLLIGWGLFNVLEGIIDHFVLRIHHVHPGADELAWDVGFVSLGLLMLAVGMMLSGTLQRHRST